MSKSIPKPIPKLHPSLNQYQNRNRNFELNTKTVSETNQFCLPLVHMWSPEGNRDKLKRDSMWKAVTIVYITAAYDMCGWRSKFRLFIRPWPNSKIRDPESNFQEYHNLLQIYYSIPPRLFLPAN